uniref:SCP domain-containing protein n=1 Tax=Mesocestoides corti TaxID=53468 RepID=A0A5K3F4P2_MESCO
MYKLIYCPHVERLAVDWVKKCLPEVPNPSIYQEYKNSQMNMLLYGSRKPSLKRIARIWYNESYDYDYDTNSCKRDCEHYTRMVWSWTTLLGCAMNRCDHLKPDWPKPVYLVSCAYKGSGSYYKGRPYQRGQSCSQCSEGYTCSRRQCSKI